MKEESCRYVLVVDDDPDIREALELMLDIDGWRVVAAPGAPEALAHLRRAERPPCLVLLDLMMPGMSGLEFIETQREDPDLATIPVVILSGAPIHEAGPAARFETLKKPVDLALLLSTVRRYCSP